MGFGMNLQASGKEGMLFTIVSVIGTMLMGMFNIDGVDARKM